MTYKILQKKSSRRIKKGIISKNITVIDIQQNNDYIINANSTLKQQDIDNQYINMTMEQYFNKKLSGDKLNKSLGVSDIVRIGMRNNEGELIGERFMKHEFFERKTLIYNSKSHLKIIYKFFKIIYTLEYSGDLFDDNPEPLVFIDKNWTNIVEHLGYLAFFILNICWLIGCFLLISSRISNLVITALASSFSIFEVITVARRLKSYPKLLEDISALVKNKAGLIVGEMKKLKNAIEYDKIPGNVSHIQDNFLIILLLEVVERLYDDRTKDYTAFGKTEYGYHIEYFNNYSFINNRKKYMTLKCVLSSLILVLKLILTIVSLVSTLAPAV